MSQPRSILIGVYIIANATNETKPEVKEIKEYVYQLVDKDPDIIQIHGFYLDEDTKLITFDLIFDFKYKEPQKRIAELITHLKEKYPEYTFYVIQDTDFSD